LRELAIAHDWVPVENAPGQPYRFPSDLSPYFKSRYDHPCIYRWNVFTTAPSDLRTVYVGEAELLSRRVYHYLHPGPSQRTNLRLKALFESELAKGRQILLEMLVFDPFTLDGVPISASALADKIVRRFMETFVIIKLRQEGFSVLNL